MVKTEQTSLKKQDRYGQNRKYCFQNKIRANKTFYVVHIFRLGFFIYLRL